MRVRVPARDGQGLEEGEDGGLEAGGELGEERHPADAPREYEADELRVQLRGQPAQDRALVEDGPPGS